MALRVAMIADLPRPGEAIDGGVQAVTSYLVRALAEKPEVELHVITLRRGMLRPHHFRQDGFVLHVLPMGRLGSVTSFSQDQRTLNQCLASIRPDIVHSQGAGYFGILANRTRHPAVITIHGILEKEVRFQPGIRSRARAAIQAWMSDKVCIRGARHTILISEYVAHHYGDALAGDKYLVPNPVDDRFFEIKRNDRGQKILYAGRIRKLKGVTDLLRAVASLPSRDGVEVVLAGSLAEAGYVNEVRSLCAGLGIEDKVKLPGLLDMDRLTQELAQCACLVLPSYQENAPMVVQEAMAAGVPVVATRVGGVPFQIKDGVTGYLYEPGDTAGLAIHLDRLMSSPELRARMGAAARALADERFRAAHTAERTLEVYRRVCSAAGNRGSETA